MYKVYNQKRNFTEIGINLSAKFNYSHQGEHRKCSKIHKFKSNQSASIKSTKGKITEKQSVLLKNKVIFD